MKRRSFLTLTALSPASLLLRLKPDEPPNNVPRVWGQAYCSCGYAMYQALDAKTVECGNVRCPNYQVKWKVLNLPLERA